MEVPMDSSSGSGCRVLIADDDDGFRTSVAAILSRAGLSVLEAVDGADVLEWARVGWELGLKAPDVVIFDVHMPSVSGLELLAEVRAAGCQTPVILITALCDDAIREAAERLGAATILEKPFEAESLLTALINVTWLDAMRRDSPASKRFPREAAQPAT
jgi:DNA-binding response OmpR family regulator